MSGVKGNPNVSVSNSSLEGEKQWSQDRNQNLKYVESPIVFIFLNRIIMIKNDIYKYTYFFTRS